MLLFSERSVWTMAHGIVFGGGALLGLGAALFYLSATRPSSDSGALRPGAYSLVTALTAVLLWITVIGGTYIVFPPYRATPPAGLTDLSAFPRSLIQANPDTAWLHAFAMESKEHMPWIAAMLATAAAFVAARHGSQALTDPQLRRISAALLAISLAIVGFVTLMGTFVNKVAPLQ